MMQGCGKHRMCAFTLIEILVVLAIIGLALMALLPRVGETIARGDEQQAFFNELLQEHLTFALDEGAPVVITGFKGSSNLQKYDGVRVTVPGVDSVNSAYVNGEETEGLEYIITVYPDGICDHFILETNRGDIFESIPLLMTVKRAKL